MSNLIRKPQSKERQYQKTRKKAYISAPIKGHDLKERQGFFAYMANRLRNRGYEPVNPLEGVDIDNPPAREECMKRDIKLLLDCDCMFVYGDYGRSEGCKVEIAVATNCGIKVYTEK